jgi:hypothetical protein
LEYRIRAAVADISRKLGDTTARVGLTIRPVPAFPIRRAGTASSIDAKIASTTRQTHRRRERGRRRYSRSRRAQRHGRTRVRIALRAKAAVHHEMGTLTAALAEPRQTVLVPLTALAAPRQPVHRACGLRRYCTRIVRKDAAASGWHTRNSDFGNGGRPVIIGATANEPRRTNDNPRRDKADDSRSRRTDAWFQSHLLIGREPLRPEQMGRERLRRKEMEWEQGGEGVGG